MEVVVPITPADHFDFNASTYAVANAPSTPRFMGDNYFSAPTSPTRIPDLQSQFDELFILESEENAHRAYSLASVPFAWEEKPGVPKSTSNLFDGDFAFDVSGEFHQDSPVSAEHMFHHSLIMIKPVEHEKTEQLKQFKQPTVNKERGRERSTSGLSSSRSRRTRSLPPFRDSEQPPAPSTTTTTTTTTTSGSSTCTTLSVFGSKKWSFKDLFLFRSASDGRAMDKDPLKKYSSIFRKHDEDFRNSTLRDRSGSGSSKRRGPRVSAHELHYTVNRAVSNNMKKQTFLPYKQGILGRLAFNPTVHALSNGFGNSHNNN